jgi:hypothetical protein
VFIVIHVRFIFTKIACGIFVLIEEKKTLSVKIYLAVNVCRPEEEAKDN